MLFVASRVGLIVDEEAEGVKGNPQWSSINCSLYFSVSLDTVTSFWTEAMARDETTRGVSKETVQYWMFS